MEVRFQLPRFHVLFFPDDDGAGYDVESTLALLGTGDEQCVNDKSPLEVI
jgi:hypothetical protein